MQSLLYINGLNGLAPTETPAETRALEKFREQGIVTTHAHLKWNRWGNIERPVQLLEIEVRKMAVAGTVAIVGFSAGGSMAMNVFNRTRDLEGITAISIAGRLKRGDFSRHSLRHLNQATNVGTQDPRAIRYPAYQEAVEILEDEIVPSWTPANKAHLTIIKPKNDFVVPLSTMDIEGVETVTINALAHHSAAVKGLRYLREQMELSQV